MMRLILFGIILFVAVLVGLFISSDPGYVLMAFHHWTVEMPLWLFVLSFLIILFSFHFVLSISSDIRNGIARWRYRRRWMDFYKTCLLTHKGLIALAEANWKEAEKDLLKAAGRAQEPLLNYLGLAFLSQSRHEIKQRDHYLQKAYQSASENKMAVEVIQAKLQLKSGQYEEALKILKRLHQCSPKNITILSLLRKGYEKAEEWESLLALLPALRSGLGIKKEDLSEIELTLYGKLLVKNEHDVIKLSNLWVMIPESLKHNVKIVLIYTQALIKNGQADQALVILKESLERNWNDELCELFGTLVGRDSEAQMAQCHVWLKKHKNSAVLLFSLASIEIRLHHWEQAEQHLLQAAQLKESAGSYLALVSVYDNLNQKDKALAMFRQYLALIN